jgi:DNA polymerase lambda
LRSSAGLAVLTVAVAGQATAYKWYAAGCRSLEDLEAGKGGVTLTDAQKIGIQFYDGELID